MFLSSYARNISIYIVCKLNWFQFRSLGLELMLNFSANGQLPSNNGLLCLRKLLCSYNSRTLRPLWHFKMLKKVHFECRKRLYRLFRTSHSIFPSYSPSHTHLRLWSGLLDSLSAIRYVKHIASVV